MAYRASNLIQRFSVPRFRFVSVANFSIKNNLSIRFVKSASSSTNPDQNEQNRNFRDEKAVFGIDLGTIRTRAAIVKHEDNSPEAKPRLITDFESVVSYTKDLQCLVGLHAARRIIPSAPNTFHATKYLIGRSYDDPVVQKFAKNIGYDIFRTPDGQICVMSTNAIQILTPGQIATLIFLNIKKLCQMELNESMKNVVITTPAHFTENQIQSTREAAQMAGLNVLKTIDEPIAAILAYGVNETDNKTVVVYDFGGTFKVSVVRIRNGELEIKSTVHDLFLGCNDFDNVLVNYFAENLWLMTGFDVTKDLISMYWLKKSAQNAITDLCYSTELNRFFYCIRCRGSPKRISIKLTRSKFEELVAEFINKTIPLCHKALKDANVAVSDIDEVLAIGGVSRIPKVKATVQKIFNKIPQPSKVRGDQVNCVANGAAIIGKNIITDITDDEVAFAQVPPQFLKPVEENVKLSYTIVDDDYDILNEMDKQMDATGLGTIFTEEEADNRIIRERTLENLMDDGDVNYILINQYVLQGRQSDYEMVISDELQARVDNLRKHRDDFVFEELCRTWTMQK